MYKTLLKHYLTQVLNFLIYCFCQRKPHAARSEFINADKKPIKILLTRPPGWPSQRNNLPHICAITHALLLMISFPDR